MKRNQLIAGIFSAFALLAGAVAYKNFGEPTEFTREIRLDTLGTKGFHIRRTITGRYASSSLPILTARESLFASLDICPGRFDVHSFSVVNQPPNLTYEATVQCRD